MFKNYHKCSVKTCKYCGISFSPSSQQGSRQKTCGSNNCKKAHKKYLNSLSNVKIERANSNKLWRKHNKSKVKKYNSKYYDDHKSSKLVSRVESSQLDTLNSRVESLACKAAKLKEKSLRLLSFKDSRVESIAISDNLSKTVSIKIKINKDLIKVLNNYD